MFPLIAWYFLFISHLNVQFSLEMKTRGKAELELYIVLNGMCFCVSKSFPGLGSRYIFEFHTTIVHHVL